MGLPFAQSLLQLTQAMAQPHKRGTIALVRDSFSKLLLDTAPPDSLSAAFLWLVDECENRHAATLWATKTTFHPHFLVPVEGARINIPEAPNSRVNSLMNQQELLSQFPLSIINKPVQTELRKIHPDLDFNLFNSEFLLPLSDTDFSVGARIIGFLHLVSSAPSLFADYPPNDLHILLSILSKASAARFTAGRRQRMSDAITKFHGALPVATTSFLLAKIVAETLLNEGRAVSCAIYIRDGSSALKLWVDEHHGYPSPEYLKSDSFFYKLFNDNMSCKVRRGIRLSESTKNERSVLPHEIPLGLDPHFTSWLTYIIRCPSYRDRTQAVPILLVRLLTIPQENHIGGSFTKNDQMICVHLGGYLTELLPDILFREASGAVTADTAEIQNKIRERLARVDFLVREREFAHLIKKNISSIHEVFIAQRTAEKADGYVTHFWNIDGAPVHSPPPFNWQLDQATLIPGTIGTKERPSVRNKLVDIPVSSIDKRLMGLRCFLNTDDLALHEWNIIEYILAELRFAVLGAFDIIDKTYQIAEIRHALNAGLTGLLGHMKLTNEVYADSLQAFRDGDIFVAQRRIFEEAQFRKTIERARISVEQVSAFFEDTRVLLADITKESLQRTSVPVPGLVDEIRILFLRETVRRRLQIVLDRRITRTTVVYDKTLLKLAVFNLIDNAVKYSFSDNQINVILDDKKHYLRIRIKNIGPHIPNDVREEIFEPFRRIRHAGGIQAMPGTGLGLAASRKIARVHGGDVLVQSDPLEIRDNSVVRARTLFTLLIPQESLDYE